MIMRYNTHAHQQHFHTNNTERMERRPLPFSERLEKANHQSSENQQLSRVLHDSTERQSRERNIADRWWVPEDEYGRSDANINGKSHEQIVIDKDDK
jgi:hypothetical protein